MWFEGAEKHNDMIYFQRIWQNSDLNTLRLMIGDNAKNTQGAEVQDRFEIGASDHASSTAWVPQFTFLTNGKL